MKKQLLLFIAFCVSLQVFHAQTLDFQIIATNASSDTTCDGELYVQCTGYVAPINYNWYRHNDSTSTIYYMGSGNYLTGLCRGRYFVEIDDNTCQEYNMGSTINNSTTNGINFQLNASLHYANDSTSEYLVIQQITGGLGTYLYQLTDENMTNVIYSDYSLTTASNIILDSLIYPYQGYKYVLFIQDSIYYGGNSGVYNYLALSFNSIQDTAYCNPNYNPLYASAQGSPVSDSSSCDGTAFVEVYGGTPPYTYQYSSGSTSDTANGLCPGSYIVTVMDADSNVFNTSFVIGYPNTYYYSGGSYNYLDTLYSNALQDCGIDYNLPVDSFYIDSSYALSNWEYVVNWTIVQDSNEFIFTETYFIDSTGYYYFGLSLYCDEAQRAISNFASYTFFSGAYADMSSFPTQVQDLSKDNTIAVYPNPSNGIFTITSSKKMTTYSIFDALGKKVVSKTTDSTSQLTDIQALNTGMYYLMVQFEDGTIGKQKLMKK